MKINITHLKQVCAISSRVCSILIPSQHLEIVNQKENRENGALEKSMPNVIFVMKKKKTELFQRKISKLKLI